MSSFEPVLMVWDYYDGPRDGVAEYNGQPYYYKCIWDERADNHSNEFELCPIGSSFLKSATAHWEIFRAWELKFRTGQAPKSTHPDYRGNNLQYDRLDDELKASIKKLTKLPGSFTATFRALPNQDDLPKNVMRNLEANWIKSD